LKEARSQIHQPKQGKAKKKAVIGVKRQECKLDIHDPVFEEVVERSAEHAPAPSLTPGLVADELAEKTHP